ncbi:hypothetical protein VNO80_24330 [Phaseolus coccineus]|uniref:Auxin-induced protein n=1 Tax=Phaseolus coccineus TaxID=3886 RepID=A0AAN9LSQ5_PHACN
MGFRLPGMRKTSFATNQASSKGMDVAKGHLAVYVGEKMKRFVIPVSYLNQPSFQDLLSQAVEEFGYDHPMGGLTIPCGEDLFLDITSRLMSTSMKHKEEYRGVTPPCSTTGNIKPQHVPNETWLSEGLSLFMH